MRPLSIASGADADPRPTTAAPRPSFQSGSNGPLQRASDLALSTILLFAAIPFMLAVAAAIYIEDGGPIFFVQPRLGRDGRLFGCFKFRSMAPRAEDLLEHILVDNGAARKEWVATQKLQHDPRVTRVGAFIRKYSLDELPQLVNILMGDMSLIGLRPIIESEIERYGRRIAYYYARRPGLTGLWQVSGRSDTGYRARVAMDVIYARRQRVALDLRILAATIPAVFRGRGSY